MLYNKVLENIKKNKENKKLGTYNGIPYSFPRLNEYLVSLDRGQAVGIVGGTGVGKTRLANFMFVYNTYKFYKETGYKCRILFFCLEDNKTRAMQAAICHYLKQEHNITITEKELNSKGRELPDFVLDKLEEANEYFAEYEKIVTYIDGISEPKEIYELCKKIALNTGNVTSWMEEIEGEKVKQYRYDSDIHTIAIFDNMSNISESDELNGEQVAILKFVKEYMRLKLCNFFNWTCCLLMQLDFESERQSFNRNGDTNINKLEPSLASIGDSKRASRSLHLIFSLFSPARFDLIHFPQPRKDDPSNTYRIDVLGNKFRSLRVIKSNDSDTGMRVGLLFDAITGQFKELPLPKTPELDMVYTEVMNKRNSFSQNVNKKFLERPKNELTFENEGYEPIPNLTELPF